MSEDYESMPVIKLEMHRMAHALYTAFRQEELNLDKMVREAIEQYCSEGNVQRIVSEAARAAIDAGVSAEVRSFLTMHDQPGREMLGKEVRRYLEEAYGPELKQNEHGLLPCPFCGDKDVEISRNAAGWPVALCNNCGASGPAVHNTPELAQEDWNKRSGA